MSHVYGCQPQIALQFQQLKAHLDAQFGVEITKRFIKKQHAWPDDQRARERHPLLLPARQLGRSPFFCSRQLHLLENRRNPALDLAMGNLSLPQSEGDVFKNVQMWPQGVVLKNQADVRSPRGYVIDRLFAQIN